MTKGEQKDHEPKTDGQNCEERKKSEILVKFKHTFDFTRAKIGIFSNLYFLRGAILITVFQQNNS